MLQGARSIGDDNQRAEVHHDLALDALAAGDPEQLSLIWPSRPVTARTSTTATVRPAAPAR
jgi:hypothetical protein